MSFQILGNLAKSYVVCIFRHPLLKFENFEVPKLNQPEVHLTWFLNTFYDKLNARNRSKPESAVVKTFGDRVPVE